MGQIGDVNDSASQEQQRQWIESWRFAGDTLEDLKRQELQAMTEEEACAASDILLQGIEFPRPPSWRDHDSGLVEQQRIFRRSHPPA